MIQEFLKSGAFVSISPTQVVVGWGSVTRSESREQNSSNCHWQFWLQSFFPESNPVKTTSMGHWYQFENSIRMEKAKLYSLLAENIPSEEQTSESPSAVEWSALDRTLYQKHFSQTIAELCQQRLQKVVLYSQTQAHVQKSHIRKALLAALNHERLHGFAFVQPTWCWLGATPEILFEFQNPNTLVVDALAGTTAITERHTLQTNPKLVQEHAFVVEDIKAQLQPLGRMEFGSVEIFEASPLAHLHQKITLHLNEGFSGNWENIIAALHPTAAVGGLPRATAIDLLRSFAGDILRFYYGAPIGVFNNHGVGRCLVGLRGTFICRATGLAQIWVGGGVTAESELESEWLELQLKAKSVQTWLSL